MLDCWLGLVDQVGDYDFAFESTATPEEILRSALSAENEPMRKANVHQFDNEALAAVIQALLKQYQVRQVD